MKFILLLSALLLCTAANCQVISAYTESGDSVVIDVKAKCLVVIFCCNDLNNENISMEMDEVTIYPNSEVVATRKDIPCLAAYICNDVAWFCILLPRMWGY